MAHDFREIFRESRFGLFLHWGLYSLLGRGEWVMNREQIPPEEYAKLAEQFTARAFDADAIASLAKAAGMRYAVLTTKHHEGFSLWDSKINLFNSVHSAAKRDFVAEFTRAMRKRNLGVGLYYSLGDWHNPDWEKGYRSDAAARKRFMEYTHGLVRELMTNYGQIDILWYDLPQNYTAEEWGMAELNREVRSLQKTILINNRGMTSEDFGTPEQGLGVRRAGRMWESCMTLNDTWGFTRGDHHYKSARDVVGRLCECAGGCGNLLLNVGPDGEGAIPPRAERLLREVGRWLQTNGEAIYASTPHAMTWNLLGNSVTARGNSLYLPVERWNMQGEIVIGRLACHVRRVSLLGHGRSLKFRQETDRLVIGDLPIRAPGMIPVLKVECDQIPAQNFAERYREMDVFPEFPA
ncbi:MAG: alpha-L-fucosidase [Victivallaceae bacterium]|nr:alpha-L-fucosidase [Victivallaceae bacterium]